LIPEVIRLKCEKGRESSKSQKMCFFDTKYKIKLFDLRNFFDAVIPVDSQTGIMIPQYDADTFPFYVIC
jgi:hypothetical protein